MSFDLPAALRRVRPQRRARRLTRRQDAALRFVEDEPGAGAPLMLDTCVYIDVLQGRAPSAMEALLSTRVLNHSAICLAELTHLFGRLDPDHRETRAALEKLEILVAGIPARRLSVPSDRALGQSGMLAGMVMRLGGDGGPRSLQNDAAVYFHALERGFVLLTRNLLQHDYFDQLCPSGRVLFYRRS